MYLLILLKHFPIKIVNYFEEKLPNEYFFMKKRERKVQTCVHDTSCKLNIQHERKGQEELSNWCLFTFSFRNIPYFIAKNILYLSTILSGKS